LILLGVGILFSVNTAGIEEQGAGSGDNEKQNSKVPAIFKSLNPLIA
jgi:hypothetical protein